MALAEEIKSKEWTYKAHEALAQAYERLGNLKKALSHFKAFHALKEEVMTRETAQKLRTMSIQHDTEKAQRESEIYRLKMSSLSKPMKNCKG